MNQVLEFNFVTPGLNGSDGLIREHYHAKKKRKEALYWEIRSSKPELHKDRVVITYTRASVVAPDWDNLCASFKHWGDSLVEAGVIKDDKPSVVVEFKPRWEKAKNNNSVYTRIEIEDV